MAGRSPRVGSIVNDVDRVFRQHFETGAQERWKQRHVFQRIDGEPFEVDRHCAFVAEEDGRVAQRRIGGQVHQIVQAQFVMGAAIKLKEILGQPQQSIDCHVRVDLFTHFTHQRVRR